MTEPLRILIVDDSPLMQGLLTQLMSRDAGLKVVGTASNGQKALTLVASLKPDLITMDLNMPVMDGRETTRQIMSRFPTPILIISSSVHHEDKHSVFELISYGALDVIDKAVFELGGNLDAAGQDLIDRIKLLSRIKVIRRLSKLPTDQENDPKKPVEKYTGKALFADLVAIAASTGGPRVLRILLGNLPKDFPCGILIVQHIAKGFAESLTKWLSEESQLPVLLAKNGMEIHPSTVYIAPHGLHMKVMSGARISLVDGIPFEGNKPSGNALFESVAEVYGSRAIGVVLTGMGTDGAEGLKKLKAVSGRVIAQDEKTSAIFGMPKAAIDLRIVDQILPIEEIGSQLIRWISLSSPR